MSTAIDDLFGQALVLSDEDRATLAARLLESLDRSKADEGVEEAWAAEIERRMDDYRAGRAKTVSWAELQARLHRRD
jgi:putative addiction module component (TIGR02574 family)